MTDPLSAAWLDYLAANPALQQADPAPPRRTPPSPDTPPRYG